MQVIPVALLLFGSGTCALIYQVAWLREMRLVFGASTAATAAVLAIFMGGLGLGGLLLGRRADQHARPLALYAQLEVLIAGAAALTPALVWLARHAYIALGGSVVLGLSGATVVRLLLAVLVLCLPTLLMGGTLPAAAKAVETEEDVGRGHLALLYGLNTLGAVTGSFAATFYLLERFGTRHTLWLACLLNLVVAGLAGALSRSRSAGVAATPREKRPRVAAAAAPKPAPAAAAARLPLFALVAAAVVGFAFLLMELVWYRMLAPLLGGSSFTFGLILAVALLGMGLGGTAYALVGGRRPATLTGFALTCALEAACIAGPYALGDRLALLTILLRPLGGVGFAGLVLGWSVVTALVVFPASVVAGVQFPLLIGLLGRGRDHVGRHVGLAYAWNTVGAIVGSLAGGFGLLPLLSAPGAWRAVVFVLVGLGGLAALLALRLERQWSRLLLPTLASVAAVMLVSAAGPTSAWRHSGIGAGRGDQDGATRNSLQNWANAYRRSIKWEADGTESSVAIEGGDAYGFIVNGKGDGNAISDASTQIMGGLVGGILHPHPTSALVVGLGTGSTAGWLGAIPMMERVDVVELEPAVLEMARVCAPVNHDVLHDAKVHIFIGDAREVLLTTPQRYDIIFSEPSNPYRAGISSLFTQEFYQAATARLTEHGIFLQWLQSYEVDSQTVQGVYGTLAAVFPVVETWVTQGGDLLLAASMQPRTYEVPALRARVEQEPFKTALAVAWHARGLEGFLAHYVANASLAQAVAAQAGDRINTDDRPLVEFGFARSVGRGGLFDDYAWEIARARHEDRPALSGGEVNWMEVADQRVSGYIANNETPPVAPPDLTAEQTARALAQTRFFEGNLSGVVSAWREQPQEPMGEVELAVLADALADEGDDAALPYVAQLRSLRPAAADAVLTHLRVAQQRWGEAAAAFEATFKQCQRDPWLMGQLMKEALAFAPDIAANDPAAGARLLRVLMTPFSVLRLNDNRLRVALQVAMNLEDKGPCVEVLRALEPYVPWQDGFLRLRLRCYEATGDARAVVARQDVEAFTAQVPVPFGRGLEPPDE